MEYRIFGQFGKPGEYTKVAIGILTIPYTFFVVNKGYDALYFPGGTKKEGESDRATLERELEEELGLNIIKLSNSYIETYVFSPKKNTTVLVKTYVGMVDGSLNIKSDEIEAVLIFEFESIDEKLLKWLNQKYLLGPSVIDAFINKKQEILKIIKEVNPNF